MKIINECLILNKDEAKDVIAILADELQFNCMIIADATAGTKKFNPKTVDHAKHRIEILHPFFCDWMNCSGTLTDAECRQMKGMSTVEIAEFTARKMMTKMNTDKK